MIEPIPTFNDIVDNYNQRLANFRSGLAKMDEAEILNQLSSLQSTQDHLRSFGIKVTDPLPKTKGRPS